jgi:hypothetical protein
LEEGRLMMIGKWARRRKMPKIRNNLMRRRMSLL